jgi:O-antigen ligase
LSLGINFINIYDSKLNIKSRDVIILNKSTPEIEKKNFSENRILNQTTTSGRVDLWSKSLNEYNKEKIFGYGPQADRLILHDSNSAYGNNVSNGLIYTFLSGGYFSALLYIILYIKIFFYILKYIKKFKTKIHLPTQLSFVYVILFSIRSLFENSYAIWGIDYMFLLVSIGILNYQVTNKKKYEGFNINNLLK